MSVQADPGCSKDEKGGDGRPPFEIFSLFFFFFGGGGVLRFDLNIFYCNITNWDWTQVQKLRSPSP